MSKAIKKPEPTPFDPIVAVFANDRNVGQMKMFGSVGLKVKGKVFTFYRKGDLVLKLPEDRVAELVKSKKGKLFDPGHGRTSKAWIEVSPKAAKEWRALSKESYAFVASSKK